MAKFGKTDPNAEPTAPRPAMDEVVAINVSTAAPAAPVVTSAEAQLVAAKAQAAMDQKVLETQLAKQDEHWMKAYWRPAMGWLYMLICFMDFVAFPAISMFIPIITKLPYVAWASLSLSNGGLIHMAFGAILGVAAYGRTQEKVAAKN